MFGGVCVKRVVESERVVMEGGDAEDSDRRHAVGDACNCLLYTSDAADE